ncbi:MAG: Vgb family protein [Gaiellaceae bacterium]
MKVIAVALPLFLAGPAKGTEVGTTTYGLAAAGGSVWVGGLGSGDVIRIDPANGTVAARVTVGARIFNLAAAPGAVWAVDNALDRAVRVDTRTGKVTTRVQVGFQPYDVEWAFGSAWVGNAGDGTVSRITNGRVVKTIKVGAEPNGLTAYRGSLWVTDHTLGTVVRIDPRRNRITATIKVAGADWITGLGDNLYVSQETNRVSRISLRTLAVAGSVRVARNPLGSAIVANELWVPCIDANQIVVVDPSTMRVLARKPAPGGPIVVLSAFGHRWVSQTTGTQLLRL